MKGFQKPTGETVTSRTGRQVDDPGEERRAYPMGREGQLGGQVGLPEKGRSRAEEFAALLKLDAPMDTITPEVKP